MFWNQFNLVQIKKFLTLCFCPCLQEDQNGKKEWLLSVSTFPPFCRNSVLLNVCQYIGNRSLTTENVLYYIFLKKYINEIFQKLVYQSIMLVSVQNSWRNNRTDCSHGWSEKCFPCYSLGPTKRCHFLEVCNV